MEVVLFAKMTWLLVTQENGNLRAAISTSDAIEVSVVCSASCGYPAGFCSEIELSLVLTSATFVHLSLNSASNRRSAQGHA